VGWREKNGENYSFFPFYELCFVPRWGTLKIPIMKEVKKDEP